MIRLSVPNEKAALLAASEFFARLAVAAHRPSPGSSRTEFVGVDTGESDGDRSVSTTIETPTSGNGCVSAPVASPPTDVLPAADPVPPVPAIPVPPVPPIVEEQVGPTPPDAATVFGGTPAPLPPTTPAPSTVDVGTDGLPWDGRIHSSSCGKIADGSFKKRRCPAEKQKPEWDAYVAQIEAELRGAMSVPVPEVTAAQVVEITPAPTTPPPPFVMPKTFAELNLAITSRGISFNQVAAAVQAVGLAGYPLLAARPDMISAVAAILFPS